ncbi:hypothetical protein M5D96_011180 [Drosophila gunungcola]|uniref:Uncharacterized protein n=1 Tax=Drosophila gunungcola TaxID=103775 RepID=A0A9P9YFM2_9MUSC|nr:hypothetical protein M5D96_011180 [Drosophila gunungcola]
MLFAFAELWLNAGVWQWVWVFGMGATDAVGTEDGSFAGGSVVSSSNPTSIIAIAIAIATTMVQ